jgi:hypothetical protein
MESRIYIALPVIDELEYLPGLIDCLNRQTLTEFRLVVCVNQPESWWNDPQRRGICERNQQTLAWLRSLNDERIILIDRSSEGWGWAPQRGGVGFARKTVMDHIADIAADQDIILCMDADIFVGPSYLESVQQTFDSFPGYATLSVPYYHRLTGEPELDRAMLRYEIYMRAYAINMWRIRNPYCFTALGSAMAVRVDAYKRMGGITPKMSGEDFYFLQKAVKTGRLLHRNPEKVFPAVRLSDRVSFGTGPALIKGLAGDWNSYPVYRMELFDDVRDTCLLFNELYQHDTNTPLDDFLVRRFGELPWGALRKNYRTRDHFVRACHEKLDGLRILQYLKESEVPDEKTSEEALQQLLRWCGSQFPAESGFIPGNVDFSNSGIELLNAVRDRLEEVEIHYREAHGKAFTEV